jgi:hypothetical protein
MGICKLELRLTPIGRQTRITVLLQRLYLILVYIGSKIGSSAAVSRHSAVDPDPDITQISAYCSNRKALSDANASSPHLRPHICN